jgi:hypothetical protein
VINFDEKKVFLGYKNSKTYLLSQQSIIDVPDTLFGGTCAHSDNGWTGDKLWYEYIKVVRG